VPPRTVRMVTSNSGNFGLAGRVEDNAGLSIGNARATERGEGDYLAIAVVRANGALLLLGEEVGPKVVAVAQPACRAVGRRVPSGRQDLHEKGIHSGRTATRSVSAKFTAYAYHCLWSS
jgi:hypothetical protein